MVTVCRLIAIALVASLLASCTAFYQRRFEIVPTQPLSLEGRKQLVTAFTEFMRASGYVAETSEVGDQLKVSFRIRDAQSRLIPASRITDTIVVSLNGSGPAELRLQRISAYPPDDFSANYLAAFTATTVKFIKEASGQDVSLLAVGSR
jgi:hypothetical protein